MAPSTDEAGSTGVVRVHDVREAVRAVRVVDAIRCYKCLLSYHVASATSSSSDQPPERP